MIRNLTLTALTSIPLTAVSNISSYFFQDWEFAKWIFIMITIDTILGIIKHLIHKDASSEDFWKGFSKKIIVYIVLLILSNVFSNYTVNGSPVGVTNWISEYLCVFMIVREAISIVENLQAIYPILPTGFIKRLKDFGENGEYINKGVANDE